MQWELIIALVIAIPLVLFPATLIWYMNFIGMRHAIRQALWLTVYVRKAAARG